MSFDSSLPYTRPLRQTSHEQGTIIGKLNSSSNYTDEDAERNHPQAWERTPSLPGPSTRQLSSGNEEPPAVIPVVEETSDTAAPKASDTASSYDSNGAATAMVSGNTQREDQTNEKGSKHVRWWCIAAVVLVLVFSIPLGFELRVRDPSIPLPENATDLQLSAGLVSIDPNAQSMVINWVIGYNCGPGGNANVTCVSGDIFFDQTLLLNSPGQGSGSNPASNNLPTPIFHINATVLNDPSLYFLGNTMAFRTQVITVSNTTFGSKERTLQAYPFDTYGALIIIFTSNHTISIANFTGIAPGFSAEVISSANHGGHVVALEMSISRGTVVKLYSISIIIAIWLVTLALLVITVSFVLAGRKLAKEVLGIPVATLFAFTSLRGTLPGAPTGFGATIDFVGILPCLAILTFCAVLMLGVYIFRRDPDKTRQSAYHDIVDVIENLRKKRQPPSPA